MSDPPAGSERGLGPQDGTGVAISKRLVIINSISGLCARAINISVLLWVYQYLIRRVDAAEYSLLPVVTSIMLFGPLLTSVLTGGVGRFIVEAHAKGEAGRVRGIVSSMVPVLIVVAIAVSAAAGLLVANIDHLLEIEAGRVPEAQLMLGLLMGVLVVRLLLIPFGTGLFVRQKYVWINLISLGTQLLRVLILLTLLMGIGPRVMFVVVASVISELVMLFLTVYISRRIIPDLRFSYSAMRRMVACDVMGFNGWTFVNELATTIRQAADVIILNRFATPVDVAAFDLGAMPERQIRRTVTDMTGPVNQPLTAMHALNERRRLATAFLKTARYSMLFALGFAAPLIIFRTEVYQLYLGQEYEMYRDAAVVMTLLLATYPFVWSSAAMYKVAYATGRVRAVAILTATAQMVNVGGALLVVGYLGMGAVGSAWVSLVTTCAVQFGPLGIYLAMRLTDLSLREWVKETVVPGLLPAAAGGAVWAACGAWLAPQGWIDLLLAGIPGGMAYAATAFAVAFDATEKAYLKGVLGQVWAARRAAA